MNNFNYIDFPEKIKHYLILIIFIHIIYSQSLIDVYHTTTEIDNQARDLGFYKNKRDF